MSASDNGGNRVVWAPEKPSKHMQKIFCSSSPHWSDHLWNDSRSHLYTVKPVMSVLSKLVPSNMQNNSHGILYIYMYYQNCVPGISVLARWQDYIWLCLIMNHLVWLTWFSMAEIWFIPRKQKIWWEKIFIVEFETGKFVSFGFDIYAIIFDV